jgi:hypothetical protein
VALGTDKAPPEAPPEVDTFRRSVIILSPEP